MNGLEDTYRGEIEFQRLNVALGVGPEAVSFYQLLGHPSFVLLSPEGDMLWKGLGVQSQESMAENIERALSSRGN